MALEIANGIEPDGIKYRVHLESPQWVVTITHPNGQSLEEKFNWAWPPRCGPDAADVNKAEEIMDKLINEIRTNKSEDGK